MNNNNGTQPTQSTVRASDLKVGDTVVLFNHMTGNPRHRVLTSVATEGDAVVVRYERSDKHRAGKHGLLPLRPRQKVLVLS